MRTGCVRSLAETCHPVQIPTVVLQPQHTRGQSYCHERTRKCGLWNSQRRQPLHQSTDRLEDGGSRVQNGRGFLGKMFELKQNTVQAAIEKGPISWNPPTPDFATG